MSVLNGKLDELRAMTDAQAVAWAFENYRQLAAVVGLSGENELWSVLSAKGLDGGGRKALRGMMDQALTVKSNRPIEPGASMPALPERAQFDPEIGRDASPWLDEYIKYSRRWSPRTFSGAHEAVGLWVLSGVAARRVVADFGGLRHTSLSMALVARTSVWAKSTTASIGKQMIDDVGLGFLRAPDDSSPEAFLRSMERRPPERWKDYTDETKAMIAKRLGFAGQRIWYHDEFGSWLDKIMKPGGYMQSFRGLLKKLDEGVSDYTVETISRGESRVKEPYVALLAALTPADLRPYSGRGGLLWRDGFFARFALVTPPAGKNRGNGRFPSGERVSPKNLVQTLRKWHYNLGAKEASYFEDDNDVTFVYPDLQKNHVAVTSEIEDAYYNYFDSLSEIVHGMELTDLDGNYTRFPEKALRIAMLLASVGGEQKIGINHWARGQAITERWRTNLHTLYGDLNDPRSEAAYLEKKIMSVIERRPGLKAYEVARYLRGKGTSEIRPILAEMVEAGQLRIDEKKCFFGVDSGS